VIRTRVDRQRRAGAGVDLLAQVLADLEERQPLGGDVHGLTGPGVAPLVGLVLAHREAAKASDLDAFASLEAFTIESKTQLTTPARFRDLRRYCIDELDLSSNTPF
jgi:hypothetical protein